MQQMIGCRYQARAVSFLYCYRPVTIISSQQERCTMAKNAQRVKSSSHQKYINLLLLKKSDTYGVMRMEFLR